MGWTLVKDVPVVSKTSVMYQEPHSLEESHGGTTKWGMEEIS